MIKRLLKEQAGFTLIEMLIVVILLGILAMLIIPQISVSTADANINTLQSNLASMRNAIELYYHQHNEVYPGAVSETDGPLPPPMSLPSSIFSPTHAIHRHQWPDIDEQSRQFHIRSIS